jgi:HrpA-like RNA helicase
MRQNSDPELLRMPLEEVCLTVLASNLAQDCRHFMSNSLQPPPMDAVEAALNGLCQMGALSVDNGHEKLTPLGQHLSHLPVDARLGKMLIYGAIFGCLDPILTITAALSASKPLFQSNPGGSETKAAQAMFLDLESDFISFVNVWDAFSKSLSKGGGRSFCRERYLNYSTLAEMKGARLQYAELLCSSGFLRLGDSSMQIDEDYLKTCNANRFGHVVPLVNNVVCAGLFPNVGKIEGRPGDEAIISHKGETLYVNSPILKKIPPNLILEWVTFHEKFGTERRTSVSCITYINPLCLLLFGNETVVLHEKRQVVIDQWMHLKVAAKTALIFKGIKETLSGLLEQAVSTQNGSTGVNSDKIIDLVAALLSN